MYFTCKLKLSKLLDINNGFYYELLKNIEKGSKELKYQIKLIVKIFKNKYSLDTITFQNN